MRTWNLVLLFAVLGCQAVEDHSAAAPKSAKIPVYYDVGAVRRTITTDSPEAQEWFNRGLALTYGFNHEEAIVCFEKAAQADPDCAMAYWGKAYALGPNYNSPAPDGNASKAAYESAQRAFATSNDETVAEKALIQAPQARYAWPAPESRAELEMAYAQATRAVWHYARGIAYASLGRVEDAEREQQAFAKAQAAVPPTRLPFNNPASEILKVAARSLDGEIEYRKRNYDAAFALLHEAVALDEQLNYDEPWGWMEPTRHALGALLTEQKRYEEAIAVYEANLARYPENGWALHGLSECLMGLGRTRDAAAVDKRFKKAWARSDPAIPGSCFCKTG